MTSLNPRGSGWKVATGIRGSTLGGQEIRSPERLRLLVREDSTLPLVSIYAAFRGVSSLRLRKITGSPGCCRRTIAQRDQQPHGRTLAEEIETPAARPGADSGNNSFSAAWRCMKPDLAHGIGRRLQTCCRTRPFPRAKSTLKRERKSPQSRPEDEQITAVARNVMREKLVRRPSVRFRGKRPPESVAEDYALRFAGVSRPICCRSEWRHRSPSLGT